MKLIEMCSDANAAIACGVPVVRVAQEPDALVEQHALQVGDLGVRQAANSAGSK